MLPPSSCYIVFEGWTMDMFPEYTHLLLDLTDSKKSENPYLPACITSGIFEWLLSLLSSFQKRYKPSILKAMTELCSLLNLLHRKWNIELPISLVRGTALIEACFGAAKAGSGVTQAAQASRQISWAESVWDFLLSF
ncbi:hypothetical protein VTL71DRAFT_10995 [Oculimacula yallundae]|uniref:Uncharacterized protein n=1 Tax=Oculimacula yallundae TaxID=86028 RepID=A0ABR4CX85_9HELO